MSASFDPKRIATVLPTGTDPNNLPPLHPPVAIATRKTGELTSFILEMRFLGGGSSVG
jgi:hypothetical protein